MNNNECKLQLLDLYFSKFDYKQERMDRQNEELNTSFEIKYGINSNDDTKIRVIINTTVSDSIKSFVLNLETVGVFRVDKENMEDETYKYLIQTNTVAIIFPFIRSQISLLTTQPGISPIVLQPINVNALIDSSATDEE